VHSRENRVFRFYPARVPGPEPTSMWGMQIVKTFAI
jgi:hypothetical protein